MLVTIKVNNKGNIGDNFILFNARCFAHSCNYGNRTSIEILDVEFDKQYRNITDAPEIEEQYSKYTAFMMDCIRHEFRVTKINGEPMKRIILNSSPTQYEAVHSINPYSQKYLHTLDKKGENIIVVELDKIEK